MLILYGVPCLKGISGVKAEEPHLPFDYGFSSSRFTQL